VLNFVIGQKPAIAVAPSTKPPTPVRQRRSSMLRSMSALGGAADQQENIRFYPSVDWSSVPTTDLLIGDRVVRRSRYGWQVDFDDFKLPFLQNVADKVAEMGGVDAN
jgi:hypothetical protein